MLLLSLCPFHPATGDRSHPAGLTRSPPGDRTDEGNQGDTQTVHRRRLMAWWEAALACDVDAYSTPLSPPTPPYTHARTQVYYHHWAKEEILLHALSLSYGQVLKGFKRFSNAGSILKI